jgi:hypothetical protein
MPCGGGHLRQNFYLYPIWEIEGEKNQKFRNLIEPKQGMNIYWMIPCKFCFCLDRKSKMSIITGQIKYRTICGNILKLLWSEPNEQFGGKFGFMPYGIMVSLLTLIGFMSRLGKTKDNKSGICCFSARCIMNEKHQRLFGSESK